MSNVFEKIKGMKVHSVFRVANIFCVSFGEDVPNALDPEDKGLHPEITIRIQCPWRIVKDGEILLATGDIYEAYSEDVGEDWNFNALGRTDGESSLFDVNIKFVEKQFENLNAESLEILGDTKDMRIVLSDGTKIDCITACSRKKEFWRITDFKEGEVLSFMD